MVIKFFIYSAIFLLFAYIVFRVIVRLDYVNKQKLSPLSYLLELLVFLLHANLYYLFVPLKWPYFPALPEDILLKILSIVFMCIGLIILIIGWFDLGSGTSFGLDKNRLKTDGIYKYSRNPQLVGYGIFLIVFVLLSYSWFALGWYILFLIISSFMVKSEEEFLMQKYAGEFEKYRSEVPRVFLFF